VQGWVSAKSGTVRSTELKHSNVSAIECPSGGLDQTVRAVDANPMRAPDSFRVTRHWRPRGSTSAERNAFSMAAMTEACCTSPYRFDTSQWAPGFLPWSRTPDDHVECVRPERKSVKGVNQRRQVREGASDLAGWLAQWPQVTACK
jgi:hypothetical protein